MSKGRFREMMENIKNILQSNVATTCITDELSEREDKIEVDIVEINKNISSLQRWVTITNNYNSKLREMILNFTNEQLMNNMVIQEEISAWINTPWYKMITKKQRASVLSNAIARGKERYEEQRKTLDKSEKV